MVCRNWIGGSIPLSFSQGTVNVQFLLPYFISAVLFSKGLFGFKNEETSSFSSGVRPRLGFAHTPLNSLVVEEQELVGVRDSVSHLVCHCMKSKDG